jgi:hypothetical protein
MRWPYLLVVRSFDRLARNMTNLQNQIADLNARQIATEFVKESLTFTGEDARIWSRRTDHVSSL